MLWRRNLSKGTPGVLYPYNLNMWKSGLLSSCHISGCAHLAGHRSLCLPVQGTAAHGLLPWALPPELNLQLPSSCTLRYPHQVCSSALQHQCTSAGWLSFSNHCSNSEQRGKKLYMTLLLTVCTPRSSTPGFNRDITHC